MRAARIDKPHSVKVVDVDEPPTGSSDILVKVKACGVCGTDIHIYEGKVKMAKFPIIPGHEFSGVIVDAGSEASKYFSIGDQVVIDPNLSCGHCIFCRAGRKHLCPDLFPIGVKADGGFAEYVRAPAQLAYKMPGRISFEEAALAEPLSCCLHGWKLASPALGFKVAILGAGPIGLLHLQLAKIYGASLIIVSEPMELRRKVAEKLGADVVIDPIKDDLVKVTKDATSGLGVDVVVEAVGGARHVEEALKIVGSGGKILIFGVASEEDLAAIKPYDVYRREITILGSFINPYSMDAAISLIASRRVDVKGLISHVISLDEVEKALKKTLKDAVKIIVRP